MTKKNICVVTGSRSDYGLLFWTLKKLSRSAEEIKLSIAVTGMHLQKEFGFTFKNIINDGFKIYKKLYINNNKTYASNVSKSISLGVEKVLNFFFKK